MFNFFETKINKERGFTMVETLVAISVLLIAMVGPLVLTRQGIVSARTAKDQTTAFYLAQDALEQVRVVRDSNILKNQNWLTGLGSCLGDGKLCKIDVVTDEITACGDSGCGFIRKSTDGLYGYNTGWPETKFRREVNILPVTGNSDEVVIQVSLFWDADQRNYVVRDYLFNLR